MGKIIILNVISFAFAMTIKVFSQEKTIVPVPSEIPNVFQMEQIKRKYGMFIHFGINTFHDQEWTDGSMSVESYNPEAVDAKQWVATAKAAGMKIYYSCS